ncbi:non-SMC mitotic condensation complex subunit 1-domain-containing protein [Hyaloraphidium curvatum]|nr:non-SMC mitotic condensation complex subunit 1-domain-containing protein [Hyaloraphidium curvatum]
MEDSEFQLHEELLKLADSSLVLEHEVNLDALDADDAEAKLNELIDSLQESPLNVTNAVVFDGLRSFLKHFDTLPPPLRTKVGDTIVSALGSLRKTIQRDLEDNAQEAFGLDRDALSMLGYLWQWFMTVGETQAKVSDNTGDKAAKRPRAGKGKKKDLDHEGLWNWPQERETALESVAAILPLDLNRIWISTSERDVFVNLFTKTTYQLLEDKDLVKTLPLDTVYAILGLCVKRYNHAFGAKTTIMLDLKSYDHLSDVLANFLHVVATKYDDVTLIEDVLLEIGKLEFNINETDVAGSKSSMPKSFARFLVRLAEILPKEVLKQMAILSSHFDAQSYSIRSGMIEVLGYLNEYLFSEEDREAADDKIESFCDILLERYRDANAFVRSKVLQVVQNLVCLKPIMVDGAAPRFGIPLSRRHAFVEMTKGRLHDKASNVRRNAIRTLSLLVNNHPYATQKRERTLNLEKLSQARLEVQTFLESQEKYLHDVLEEAGVPLAPPKSAEAGEDDSQEAGGTPQGEAEAGGPAEQSEAVEKAQQLQERLIPAFQKILTGIDDAVRFAQQMELTVPVMCELLASKAKSEVLEAMDFFVTLHRSGLESAKEGLRRMIHLVWNKDANSEEGRTVKSSLMDCFHQVYIASSDGEQDKISAIVKNLIGLTRNATLADLTSLEHLLATMMSEGRIPAQVVDVLWQLFASTSPEVSKAKRRGALNLISMFSKTSKNVLADRVDLLLRVGLIRYGREDFELARLTCVALQHLIADKQQKGSATAPTARESQDHPMFRSIASLLLERTRSIAWFGFAEQAINTIYLLCDHPDVLCGDLIKRMASALVPAGILGDSAIHDVRDATADAPSQVSSGAGESSDANAIGVAASDAPSATKFGSFDLSKLLFAVGHVAIKQIVHLENIETEWKRRKAKDESEKKKATAGGDEIEQVVGTVDDEFSEMVHEIRERELLFGDQSLLSAFGPLVAHICANNRTFADNVLQVHATLALCKFMCVSSEFCESHLQLLFTILEKTTEPTVRSNIIIALGDMTVSFNSLIDQNISYLYKRLSDSDMTVKKNTLMVLTHLILNGMVKVKGQISEMAKCLEDSDSRISDLAKLFFTELATKDNAIYNNLPDIISNLSSENGVDEETFQSIMAFLLEFIDKEKQTENIAEKLCLRFRNATSERQWRDISFCLSLLSFKSERTVKKLIDNQALYADKLHEDAVFKHFEDIIGKARKSGKQEMKQTLDDFEGQLNEFRAKCLENQEALTNADATGRIAQLGPGDLADTIHQLNRLKLASVPKFERCSGI